MDKAWERFQEACKQPVDINKCREALQRLIDGKHTLHVPPQLDDEDIIIMRAIDELARYRGEE